METLHDIEGVVAEIDGDACLAAIRARLTATFDDDPSLETWLHPVGESPSSALPESLIDEAIDQAVTHIQSLIIDSGARLDRDDLERLALGVERVRRCAEAAVVAVAGVADVQNPHIADGFRSGKNWIRHRAKLSPAEAFRRVQLARMHRRLPSWSWASESGEVGIAQSQLMAQIAANPRISDETLLADADNLLDDAIRLSYPEFEALARRWESLADPIGAAEKSERLHANRSAHLVRKPGGGWTLVVQLDDIGGEEFNHVLNHFTAAETEFDLARAVGESDDTTSTLQLRRTETQRRADALLNIGVAAAACPPDGVRPVPVLNLLGDIETVQAAFNDVPISPSRYRDVICRTNTGRALDPYEVVKLIYWAEVRRAIVDDLGVVIDLGRRRRCFTGAAREAAKLTSLGCDWPGCDVPPSRCQVDHVRSWARHGETNQANAGCACGWHNRLKEQGYRVHRSTDHTWHFFHPDGHEIL